jgi:hypothetical protein
MLMHLGSCQTMLATVRILVAPQEISRSWRNRHVGSVSKPSSAPSEIEFRSGQVDVLVTALAHGPLASGTPVDLNEFLFSKPLGEFASPNTITPVFKTLGGIRQSQYNNTGTFSPPSATNQQT